jgi:uncharacterized membrane protein YdbT with pleckstrin-like domain
MEYVWKSRKRNALGLPWTFTKYMVTSEKIIVDTGVFTTHSEEVRLYRVLDVSLRRSFGQRMCGLGTITFKTADKTLPLFEFKNIRKSRAIRDMISDMVEQERMKKRVISREAFDGFSGDNADEDSNIEESY